MSAGFGAEPTFERTDAYGLSVSEDGQVFTLRFSDFTVKADPFDFPVPIATRTFSIVLPVDVTQTQARRISFFLAGLSDVFPGTNGYAVFSVNGITTHMSFPQDINNHEFLLRLELETLPVTECRVTVFVQVERDSKDAPAQVTVTTLEGAISQE